MNLKQYKYCRLSLINLLILINGAISLATALQAIAVNAEEITPVPDLGLPEANPSYISSNTNSDTGSREYTFKAPGNKTLGNTEHLAAVKGYKVEVYGNAADLLLQVRSIEPKAFISGNIIQVGIFSQQNNAEDMVRQLAVAGFWARIVNQ